jgi:hypothetical protein
MEREEIEREVMRDGEREEKRREREREGKRQGERARERESGKRERDTEGGEKGRREERADTRPYLYIVSLVVDAGLSEEAVLYCALGIEKIQNGVSVLKRGKRDR